MKFILGLILAFGITQVSAQLKITNIKSSKEKVFKETTKFELMAKTNLTNCECESNEMITCKLSKVTEDSIYLLVSERIASSGSKKKLTSSLEITYNEGHEVLVGVAKNQVQGIRKLNKAKSIFNRDIGIPLITLGVINGLVVSPLLSNKLRPKFDIATYSLLGAGILCASLKLSTDYFFQQNDYNKPIEWKF